MSRQKDIEKLITEHSRRLQKLKEQAARAGGTVDPKINLEIEDIWVSPIFVLKCPLRNEKSLVKNGYFPFSCGNLC